MKLKLAEKATSMGWRVYRDSIGKCIIELPIKSKEVILKKQQPNKWLLISDRIPQAVLETKEESEFIQEIVKRQKYIE